LQLVRESVSGTEISEGYWKSCRHFKWIETKSICNIQVDFVDRDDVDLAGADLIEQGLQGGPFQRGAGERAIVIALSDQAPALVGLALDMASQASRWASSELNSMRYRVEPAERLLLEEPAQEPRREILGEGWRRRRPQGRAPPDAKLIEAKRADTLDLGLDGVAIG
jgi:hypothetical protein